MFKKIFTELIKKTYIYIELQENFYAAGHEIAVKKNQIEKMNSCNQNLFNVIKKIKKMAKGNEGKEIRKICNDVIKGENK